MKTNGDRINLMALLVSMPVGGVEMQVLSILERLDPGRYNRFICCIRETGALAGRAVDAGIEILSLDTMRSSRFSLHIAREIARVMKTRNADVLWTHQYVANLYGRLATFMVRPPVVISTFHALYDRPKLHRSIFNRLLSQRADALVAVSGAVAGDMKKYDRVGSGKVRIIYNGIALTMFNVPESKAGCRKRFDLPGDGVLIGAVGRLSKEKNHAVMIEALKKLPGSVKGVIVGDGSLKGQLEASGGGRCYFPGHVDHDSIPFIMKAMDIYCSPSLWEGFGMSLVEAMAAGLPVVASDIPPHREILGTAGILFTPDSPDALASALALLADDPERRARLGDAAKARSAQFSLDNTVAAYEKIIEDTLKRKSRDAQ